MFAVDADDEVAGGDGRVEVSSRGISGVAEM